MTTGLSISTGQAISGADHLRQSIGRILTTPIGTRVMRRDFGSLLFELLDQPFNASTRVRLYAAIAVALGRWEPRIRLRKIAIAATEIAGSFILTLEGIRTDLPAGGAFSRLTIPLRTAANGVITIAA